ncbi:MAG: VCBS repeat-containing protein [Polyangiales bacterium]
MGPLATPRGARVGVLLLSCLAVACARRGVGEADVAAVDTHRDLPAAGDVPDALDAGARDVPRAPAGWARQLAPLAGARVTQRRPTLRWTSSPDHPEVRVEVCDDRPCTRVSQQWSSATGAGRPPDDLAPGVHFWRLRVGGSTTPAWPFVAPPRAGDADTSWNARADLNGDGRDDVVVLSRDDDAGAMTTVRTYPGRANDLPGAAVGFAVSGEPRARAVGDLDGDGYGDLALRRVCVVPGEDRIEIHRGGPEGPAATPAPTIAWSGVTCVTGLQFVGVGDVNGDGYGDLLALSPRPGGGFRRRVELYLGAPVGEAPTPSAVLEGGTEYSGFGDPRALGDVNGDGFADVAVVSRAGRLPSDGVLPARVEVYLGGVGGLPVAPSLTVQSPAPEDTGFGVLLDAPFDGDGDGFADLAVGNRWFLLDPMAPPARVVVYRGGRAGLATTGEVLALPPYTGNLQGANAQVPVDLDHDGRDEIVVFATQRGRVAVVRLRAGAVGGDAGVDDLGFDDRALIPPSGVMAGDLDGDGRADLLAALRSPGADAPATTHALVLLRGGAWPEDPTPRVWIQGPAGAAMTLVW